MAIKGEKRRLGFRGERKAARYLKKNGYKIIERNFKCKAGEIDLIAAKGEVLAFIEVKTRSSDSFGAPCEAVDARRQRRYINAARFYFYANNLRVDDFIARFDIAEVTRDGVNHIENAFEWS